MAKLGDAFSDEQRRESVRRQLKPGAVVYIDVVFPEGRKPKYLVAAHVDQECCTALYRLGQGNFSNAKGVGGGVFEYRIDFGPGYRVYFGKDGAAFVILLGGSTKKRQSLAIAAAAGAWTDYKRRKPAR